MPAGSAVVVGVGAEEGLGASLAQRFARDGFRVIVAGRTAARLKAHRPPSRNLAAGPNQKSPTRRAKKEVIGLFDKAAEHGDLDLSCTMWATMPRPLCSISMPRISKRFGGKMHSAAFWSGGRRCAGCCRGAGARSFLLGQRLPGAPGRPSPALPQPKPLCAPSHKDLRGNSARKASTLRMWSLMVSSTAPMRAKKSPISCTARGRMD